MRQSVSETGGECVSCSRDVLTGTGIALDSVLAVMQLTLTHRQGDAQHIPVYRLQQETNLNT